MRSLRTTLIMGTTAGSTVILLIAGIVLYAFVSAGLVRQFDEALIDKAKLIASSIEIDERGLDLQFRELDMHELEKADKPAYLQLWISDGHVLYRSPSLGREDIEKIPCNRASPVYRWLTTLPSGRTGRAVGISFSPRLDEEIEGSQNGESETDEKSFKPIIKLVFARDTSTIDNTLALLAVLLAIIGIATIGLTGAVLWSVVRWSLRPVEKMAAQISRIGEEDLSIRIRGEDVPVELLPIVTRLNDLLERLEAAFRRERSFSADVAHELRTPLSGLRSTMEVALSKPRETQEYREAISDSLQIATQMQAMVENLLTLARLEAGQVDFEPAPIAVNELLRTAWNAGLAEKRHLQVQWKLGPDSSVMADKSLLTMVIRNIFENAAAYANEGGLIGIETRSDNDATAISVSNSGSNLTQKEAEQAFNRFWRGDEARSAAGVHCGLGLSLVKKIAAALGGTVGVQSGRGGSFTISVSFPRKSAS